MPASCLAFSEAGLFFVSGEYSDVDEVGFQNQLHFNSFPDLSGKGGNILTPQNLYALLYLEINVMATVLIAIIWHRTAGLSKMVAQRNFAMTIAAEIVFFVSDTVAVMMTTGFLPLSRDGLMAAKEVYFFSTTIFLLHDADVFLLVCLF